MKSTITSIILIFTVSLVWAKAQGPLPPADISDIAMHDEEYVNDIPFDTWKISMASKPESLLMHLPEEAYIDDIPFDTRKIAYRELLTDLLRNDEEPYVNDIPFNTEKIALKALFMDCMADYLEESNVNDIPFNTRYLACCQQMMTKLMPQFREEKAVQDISFDTEEIASIYLFKDMVKKYRNEETSSDMPVDYMISCCIDRKMGVMTFDCSPSLELQGFRSKSNVDFRMDMERYMNQFNKRIHNLDHLTIDEPF